VKITKEATMRSGKVQERQTRLSEKEIDRLNRDTAYLARLSEVFDRIFAASKKRGKVSSHTPGCCRKDKHIMIVKTCRDCGEDGAHCRLCPKCAKRLGACPHCGAFSRIK
jgi:hypothetical protein